MNLICPHEKYFSQDIKKKFKKILACNFTNINQAKFNKLFYKFQKKTKFIQVLLEWDIMEPTLHM